MNFLLFLFRRYWLQMLFAIAIFGGLVYMSIRIPERQHDIAWLESIAGAGTLFFAVFLWFNAIYREWEDKLPKHITVQFQWQGRNVMVCYNARLTSASDARTWALQIGQQMSGCQRLKFDTYFSFEDKGIKPMRETKELYKSYLFTYYLKELPEPDNSTPEVREDFKWQLENGCIEYSPVYHPDGSISMGKGYYASTSQKIN